MNPTSPATSDGARRAAVITEGRRKEALLTAEALQNAIFNSANFSSIATDARGVIQIFNVGAERMLGYTAAEVMNQITPADISDPQEVIARATAMSLEFSTEIAPGFEALVFKASREIEDIYELTYIRKDGSRFPALVSVTALRDEPGAIIGYLLIGTDNTARKRVEAEQQKLDQLLRAQNVELSAAKVVAEKANQAKSDFLSSMSHELRSPLNGILGFAQLMESDTPPPTPRQQESIGQILQAGWHLLKLINEILDLAKVESGMLSLSPESVSLSEVMAECQAMLEGQAQKRGIQITFPLPDVEALRPRRPDQAEAGPHQPPLQRGQVQPRAGHGRGAAAPPARQGASASASATPARGCPRSAWRSSSSPSTGWDRRPASVEGTGIGLVVAKQLVELMEGVIGVESEVGVGSTFWFELAAAAEPRFAVGSGEPNQAAPPRVQGGRPVRLLLYVEDNLANLKLVERLVERRPDLSLISAETGARGIKLARSRRPDVVLMDINLPDISGLEALVVLRGDPATALIPVIAISANAMPHDINRGRQAGFFEYLTKPIQVNEFMRTLDAALALADRQSGRAPIPEVLA